MQDRLISLLAINPIIDSTFFNDLHKTFTVPDELNTTHIKTMVIVGDKEKQTMSSVSKELNLEKGSFTPVANRLINNGYIQKVQSSEDRRIWYLELTKKGKDFVAELRENLDKHVQKKLGSLDEDERNLYFAAIQIVINITKKIK